MRQANSVESITIGRFNTDSYLEGNTIDVRHYPTAHSADWVAEEFIATNDWAKEENNETS